MEDLLATDPRSGKPTNFGAAFRTTVRFLHARQIPHVFIGTLALNAFIRPRFTDEIQVVCDYVASGQLAETLRQAVGQDAFGGKLGLWHAESPAMAYALASRAPQPRFDVQADMPSALALCWLFLESEDPQSQVDAGSLLSAGTVCGEALQVLLEQHAREAALHRLHAVNRSIRDGAYSGTYQDSMRARLLRRRRKDAAAD